MYWQSWSERLKSILHLKTEPIAVTFTSRPPAVEDAPGGKLSVCQAVKKAGDGEPCTISADTCGCPGGLVNLGLGEIPPENYERLVNFLVEREKVYCSRAALHRGQQIVPAPVGMASHVVFTPLLRADLQPDLVVFVGSPGSLHQLIGFADYWEGGSLKAELAGPACRTGIAYPIVTGEVGLSLLDFGARRLAHFDDHQLLISIPFHRMIGIMHALDQGAGAARDESPEVIEKRIDELGRVRRV